MPEKGIRNNEKEEEEINYTLAYIYRDLYHSGGTDLQPNLYLYRHLHGIVLN
jgi:hypothetical protein